MNNKVVFDGRVDFSLREQYERHKLNYYLDLHDSFLQHPDTVQVSEIGIVTGCLEQLHCQMESESIADLIAEFSVPVINEISELESPDFVE